MPKQNTHTVTRNISTGAKKAVKTKDSLLKGTNKAVKTGNSYVGKSAKKKAVKSVRAVAMHKIQKRDFAKFVIQSCPAGRFLIFTNPNTAAAKNAEMFSRTMRNIAPLCGTKQSNKN